MRQAAAHVEAGRKKAKQLASIREVVAGGARSSIWSTVLTCLDTRTLSCPLRSPAADGRFDDRTATSGRRGGGIGCAASAVCRAGTFPELGNGGDRFCAVPGQSSATGRIFVPEPVELWFLSTAHSGEDLDHVVAVVRNALDTIPESR